MRIHKIISNLFFVLISIFVLAGCGGGGGSAPTDTTKTAYLVDSALEGINYTCGTISGVTDKDGKFSYDEKVCSSVSFSLGSLSLGTVNIGDINTTDNFLTIQELAGTSRADISNETVQKLAVFLQSLDSDNNSSNGITIDDAIKNNITLTGNFNTKTHFEITNEIIKHAKTPKSTYDAMEHVVDSTKTLAPNIALDTLVLKDNISRVFSKPQTINLKGGTLAISKLDTIDINGTTLSCYSTSQQSGYLNPSDGSEILIDGNTISSLQRNCIDANGSLKYVGYKNNIYFDGFTKPTGDEEEYKYFLDLNITRTNDWQKNAVYLENNQKTIAFGTISAPKFSTWEYIDSNNTFYQYEVGGLNNRYYYNIKIYSLDENNTIIEYSDKYYMNDYIVQTSYSDGVQPISLKSLDLQFDNDSILSVYNNSHFISTVNGGIVQFSGIAQEVIENNIYNCVSTTNDASYMNSDGSETLNNGSSIFTIDKSCYNNDGILKYVAHNGEYTPTSTDNITTTSQYQYFQNNTNLLEEDFIKHMSYTPEIQIGNSSSVNSTLSSWEYNSTTNSLYVYDVYDTYGYDNSPYCKKEFKIDNGNLKEYSDICYRNGQMIQAVYSDFEESTIGK